SGQLIGDQALSMCGGLAPYGRKANVRKCSIRRTRALERKSKLFVTVTNIHKASNSTAGLLGNTPNPIANQRNGKTNICAIVERMAGLDADAVRPRHSPTQVTQETSMGRRMAPNSSAAPVT